MPSDPLQHSAIHPFTQAFGEPAHSASRPALLANRPLQGTAIVLRDVPQPQLPQQPRGQLWGFPVCLPRLPGHLVPKQVLSIVTWPYSLVGPTPANSHTTKRSPTPGSTCFWAQDVDQCIPDRFCFFLFFFFFRFCFFCSVPLGLILHRKKSLNMKAGKCFKNSYRMCN